MVSYLVDMKKVITTLATSTLLAVSAVMLLTLGYSPFVGAEGLNTQSGAAAAKGAEQPTNLTGATGVFSTVTNVLLFIIGAVAVIMIIVGGLRYITSGGNSANVTAAKNTILYALVGVIVAILAFAAVNFVIGSFTAGSGTNV